MNEEKEMNEQESLFIIQQMIDTAKKEQKDDGGGWILWGWLLFAASALTLLNIQFHWSRKIFFFWNAFGLLSIAYFIYKAIAFFFIRKTVRLKTYTGDLFAKLNVGFFISLLFIIVSINVGGRVLDNMTPVNIGFALLINLYAFWIYIYGSALNFKPSVVGAYVAWALGFVAVCINNFEKVMALHAAAVLFGYIVPGHIANREFNKLRRKDKF
jgi:hypothetical protein